jgi:acyl-CoA synthetase (AMP-forming)/AMP-acid ligase II
MFTLSSASTTIARALRTLKMTTRSRNSRASSLCHGGTRREIRRKEARSTRSHTYKQLDARANQYARWALAQVKKGDAVCLFMLNGRNISFLARTHA